MTWNPAKTDPSLTLSNNNLTVAKASGFGSHAKSLGVAAAQGTERRLKISLNGAQDIGIGLATVDEPLYSGVLGAAPATSACIWSTGWYQDNSGQWHQYPALQAGQEVTVFYNPSTKSASWLRNGTLIVARTLVLSGDAFPAISLRYQPDKATADFTQWADAVVEPPPPPPPPPPSGEAYYVLITNDPDYTA